MLIVVGITIALTANSWYAGLKEDQDEELLLRQLQQSLTVDQEQLSNALSNLRLAEQDIIAIVELLQSVEPFTEEFAPYFNSLIRYQVSSVQSAPFETLKIRGLGLISNEALRFNLSSLFEDDVPLLQAMAINQTFFSLEMAQPYFFENFRRVTQEENSGWFPRDYGQVKSDGYLENLSLQKLRSINLKHIGVYERVIFSISKVLDGIEKELTN
ncbi:MAG: hypothetical protein COA71_08040 [SAR86 cluster bacterium]|uniref:Uncharacterized protein n=1 Tax=SAR86 cluster bacterium TaxID=2030880 RepID=A0A2A5CCD1_9GAMM|nr:MAG: hypothetical protein COA71_08040 [SAR86 cluster bacterium]